MAQKSRSGVVEHSSHHAVKIGAQRPFLSRVEDAPACLWSSDCSRPLTMVKNGSAVAAQIVVHTMADKHCKGATRELSAE